jgi:hypothetical protein
MPILSRSGGAFPFFGCGSAALCLCAFALKWMVPLQSSFNAKAQGGKDARRRDIFVYFRGAVSEEKLRLVKEEQARLEAERSKPEEPGGLSPENIKKIRESLNLH